MAYPIKNKKTKTTLTPDNVPLHKRFDRLHHGLYFSDVVFYVLSTIADLPTTNYTNDKQSKIYLLSLCYQLKISIPFANCLKFLLMIVFNKWLFRLEYKIGPLEEQVVNQIEKDCLKMFASGSSIIYDMNIKWMCKESLTKNTLNRIDIQV